MNLYRGQLVGLSAIGQVNPPYRHLGLQRLGDLVGCATPRRIPIQQQDEALEMTGEQMRLASRESRSHQRDHVAMAGLVELDGVEEAFHQDGAIFPGVDGAMEVKQGLRFPKAGWEPVFGWLAGEGTASVGDQLAAGVVDGDHQPARQEAGTAIQSYAEEVCSGRRDSALSEIGMLTVDVVKPEAQGRIGGEGKSGSGMVRGNQTT